MKHPVEPSVGPTEARGQSLAFEQTRHPSWFLPMPHAQSDTDIQCSGTDKEMDLLNSWDTKYYPCCLANLSEALHGAPLPADLGGAANDNIALLRTQLVQTLSCY
jgi:hypothetical protein